MASTKMVATDEASKVSKRLIVSDNTRSTYAAVEYATASDLGGHADIAIDDESEAADENEVEDRDDSAAGNVTVSPFWAAITFECDNIAGGLRRAYFLKWLTLFLRHKLKE
jgi:hypothetical protein